MKTLQEKPLHIAVMGAGAVGCYFGGMLARAGHTVTLIGRAAHVEAMQRDGLLLDTQTFKEHVRVNASTEVSAIQGAQIVLFCVKSTDTVSAATAMAPYLNSQSVIISLQNGVENAAVLQGILPQEVIPAVVYVATEMAGPGHLRHHGRGELVIGASASSVAIAAAFGEAAIPVQVSDNVAGALWSKLIINCAYNALSAIGQLPYGRLVQAEGVATVMSDAVQECLVVAHADGVIVPADCAEMVPRIALGMADQYSSTAQDLARRKPNEIDYLNGYVCRRGLALGIPTPVNHALTTIVKLVAQR